MEQRMSVSEAETLLAEYKAELAAMGGKDKSGYLQYQIDRLETALSEFKARGANG